MAIAGGTSEIQKSTANSPLFTSYKQGYWEPANLNHRTYKLNFKTLRYENDISDIDCFGSCFV